jgi:thiamine pyrophosphokinase
MGGTAALVANGGLDNPALIARFVRKCDYVIAVDGGLHHCEAMGVRPDCILGDFDSVEASLLEKYDDIPQLTFPADKDFTDLELGIEKAWEREPDKVFLFCALGKRTDHSLYNLQLLGRLPGKLWIETETETLYAIEGQHEIACTAGQTVSFFPMYGHAEGVTTKGLKWELRDATMGKELVSISNIALKPKVNVAVRKGILLCCLVKGQL